MEIKDLKGKLIAVLGYGIEGKATTAYLLSHGVRPVLFDHRPWSDWAMQDQEHIKSLGVNFIFGPDCLKELVGFEVAFRSPGIPYLHPDIQSRISGQKSQLTVTSQTKWFFDNCPCKIIGITGTKGKGTTSTLLYEMLRAGEHMAKGTIYLTGNIGETQPLDFLDTLKTTDRVVYEMSSFQLQDLRKSPHVAVVLMTTQEHLDHHATVDEYHDAKANIAKHQNTDDVCIYNSDYSASVKIGRQSKGVQYQISRSSKVTNGCYAEAGAIVAHLKNGDYRLETKYLQLRGQHNLENICAAVCAALSLHVHEEDVQKILNNFTGLRYRLQFIGKFSEVNFYNDSFSTTPETAIAAIQSFTEPEILILGGSSKNSDFSELGKIVAQAKNIKSILLIGQESERIKESIMNAGGFFGKFLEGATTMASIFDQIRAVAETGDVVLLSPGCASFGMFKNYKDRGEQFTYFAQNFSR